MLFFIIFPFLYIFLVLVHKSYGPEIVSVDIMHFF